MDRHCTQDLPLPARTPAGARSPAPFAWLRANLFTASASTVADVWRRHGCWW